MAHGRDDPDTYTVHDRADRADVRQWLDQFGVEGAGQIRQAHGSHDNRLTQAEDAGHLDDLHATGTPAANLQALGAAMDGLSQAASDVEDLLGEAWDLATPMRDGHGPIARAMRAAFREQAGDVRGVVRALTDYRDELNLVLTAVQQTVDSYRRGDVASDVAAARLLNAPCGDRPEGDRRRRPRGAQRLGGVRWEHYSHRQLWNMIMDAHPDEVFDRHLRWVRLGRELVAVNETVQRQLNLLFQSWQGATALSAALANTRLLTWSQETAQSTQRVGDELGCYGHALGEARKRMPPQSLSDHRATATERAEAWEVAIEVMRAFEAEAARIEQRLDTCSDSP